MTTIALGPFDLHEPIGRGGMGVVWRATHRHHGIGVAVKVLNARRMLAGGWAERFRYEVRAVARLDHPNIVAVYEYGVVPEPERSRDLPPGSPFLAMDLGRFGSLAQTGCGDWSGLRDTLAALLAALAHAHARGVLHRDLKPSNVLAGAVPRDVRLVDFGLAMQRSEDLNDPSKTGTPAFMAPEQFEGRWRDYGPWTDLYALGAVGWALTTGRPPYGDLDGGPARMAHLYATLPALEPLFPVSIGLERWLRTLLAKDPAHRFRRAADAHAALLALAAPTAPFHSAGVRHLAAEATLTLDGEEPDAPVATSAPSPPAPRGIELPMAPEPPPPAATARPPALAVTGLSLYGLRDIPLVGRTRECSALWRELWQARTGRRPRAVVVTGAPAVGKSHLVRWLCTVAHEVGLVGVLKAIHGPIPGPLDGLAPMVRRVLRCDGLSGADLRTQARRALLAHGSAQDADIAAIAAWLAAELPTRPEQLAAFRSVLAILGRERFPIVWLEDAQFDLDAVEAARAGLSGPAALYLLTVPDELDPALREAIDQLLAHPRATRLPVGPVAQSEHTALIRALLPLEWPLARTVAERTQGQAHLAMRLVGEWVRADLLAAGPDGFRLRDGVEPALPATLADAWSDRLDRALAGRDGDDVCAVELAAALGQDLAVGEWRAACATAGLHPSDDLLDALLAEHALIPLHGSPPTAVGFAHAQLRAAVAARSRAAGRWSRHHLTCARTVVDLDPGAAERIGRHLAEGGRHEEALEPLIEAAIAHDRAGRYTAALATLDLADRLVAQAELPAHHPRAVASGVYRTLVLFNLGRPRQAATTGREAVYAADACGEAIWIARAAEALATVLTSIDDWAGALAVIDHGLAAVRDSEAPALRLGLLLERAELAFATGDLQTAEGIAVDLARVETNGPLTWTAADLLARIARKKGDIEGLREWAARILEFGMQTGRRPAIATAESRLGEAARMAGDLEAAESHHRRALQMQEDLGTGHYVTSALNLAIVLLQRGRFRAAREVLERLPPGGPGGSTATSSGGWRDALLARAAAGAGDWPCVDACLARLEAIRAADLADTDLAGGLSQLASDAEGAGRATTAGRALRLVAGCWLALGRPDEAERAHAALHRLTMAR